MRETPVKAKKKYELKFTLIYLGLFLLEPSILFGNATRYPKTPFTKWIEMTSAHLSGVLLALVLVKTYAALRRQSEFSFRQLLVIGLFVSGSASLAYSLLGHSIHAPLAKPVSVVLTVLIFGVFWFPQAIMMESLKKTIFESMETYEQRLIIQSRQNIRDSSDFAEIEGKIISSIVQELREKCAALIARIQTISTSDSKLDQKIMKLRDLLSGTELREFSIQLEQRGKQIDHKSYVNTAIGSIQLFARQYRLLYWQSARYHQLSSKTYTLILLLVVAPSMFHYLTIIQILFTTVALSILSFGLATVIGFIIRANGKRALLNSSLLTYAIGSLPCVLQPFESKLFPDDKVEYPLFILAFMVPAGYYLLIKTLQLIQPSTHKLIESGELVVSAGVKRAVGGVIEYEFAQTLSHSWAIFVHGKILTRLAATSMRIEQAREKQDEQAFHQAIDSLIEILKSPELAYSNEIRTLDDELHMRLTPWEGLVEIDIEKDSALNALSGSRITDLGELLEEAISNSVRHGKSGKIHIHLDMTDHDEVRVILKDNSTIDFVHDHIRFGLGTKLFNLVSDGRWNLHHGVEGTTFTATINMQGSAE